MTRKTVEERFWEKVDRSGGENACWEWTRATNRGRPWFDHSKERGPLYAHRFAYELTHGPIPDGLLVCHHCDNPMCVNPAHLWLGTYKDNTQDMLRKGRGLEWRKNPRPGRKPHNKPRPDWKPRPKPSTNWLQRAVDAAHEQQEASAA